MCYVRITQVLRYEQAEQLCQQYGLSMAIIDNLPLLEQLKQSNMCIEQNDHEFFFLRSSFLSLFIVCCLVNTTCKGQCPEARGYYIGLQRQTTNDNGLSESEWIWSNNVTWKQNETEVSTVIDLNKNNISCIYQSYRSIFELVTQF
jgi:hypothetical protein